MRSMLVLVACASALFPKSTIARAAADPAGCQKLADKIASVIGVPTTKVADNSFVLQKDRVAIVDGECGGPLSIRPEPEPFDKPLSPSYPNLVVRVAVAAFDLEPAEVRQAIAACLKGAVADPLNHTGRAGFARQRWRSSQMTGKVTVGQLKWECTYHNSEKLAASVTISKMN